MMRRLRWGAIVAGAIAAQALAAQTIPVPLGSDLETRQVSVVVTPGVRSMRQVPTAALRRLRTQMHQGVALSDIQLKTLADLGDGLAAQRYARALLARGAQNPSDIAYYSAIAVGTGRVWTLPDMIEAMRQIDPETEPASRVRKYMSVLYGHAWGGNTLALDAVAEFNGTGKLFGDLSDATRDRMLAQSAENRDGRLEIRMALEILERAAAEGNLPPAEAEHARRMLDQAAQSESLAARATAENLLAVMEMRYNDP